MSTPNIPFYKLRDFGDKMSTTIDFLKENFKKLFWSLLLIGGPVAILISVVFRDIFAGMFDMGDFADPTAGFDFFARMGFGYVISMLLLWLTTTMIIGMTYSYMIKYNNGDLDNFSIGELFSEGLKKLPGLLGLSFLISLVVIVGIVLCIIPGIYLGVVLSLAYPIYMFENKGVGDSFSRAFQLIKDKFWSTLGVVFIGYLMAYVVQIVFSIPFFFVYISELFTLIEEAPEDPTSFMNMFSSGYMTIAVALQYIGQFVSLCIPLIAIAYQYSNLVERQEGVGLLQEIDDFDKKD